MARGHLPLLLIALLVPACAGDLPAGVGPGDHPAPALPGDTNPTGPVPPGDGTSATSAEPATIPPCPANAEALFADIVSKLQADLSSNNVPGAALALVCGGDRIFTKAMGIKRSGSTEPVTTQTRFQWASTTKMFTAATAVALAEDGVVDLEAPISAHLPSVGYGSITLEQLLSHSAGFPTVFGQNHEALDQVVLQNGGMAMWATPGAVWNYSNPGYSVAGFVLEKATGQPFGKLVEAHVAAPAGMRATLDVSQVLAGDFAHGHTKDPPYNNGPIAPDGAYFATTYYGPMGGMWGSIGDLAQWAKLHITGGDSVLEPESMARLRTSRSATTYPGTDYGLGLFVRKIFSPRVYDHGGSSPGFGTEWMVIPEAGFALAVVVNCDWHFPTDVLHTARDLFVKLEERSEPRAEGANAWPQYVGRYDDPNELGPVEIVVEGGRLIARLTNKGSEGELQHLYGDAYEIQVGGELIDINFWRPTPDQKATHLVSLWGVATRSGF